MSLAVVGFLAAERSWVLFLLLHLCMETTVFLVYEVKQNMGPEQFKSNAHKIFTLVILLMDGKLTIGAFSPQSIPNWASICTAAISVPESF